MKNTHSVAGLILPVFMLGFAAFYWVANRHVPDQDMRMVKPLIVILIILALLQCLRWLRGRDSDGGARLTLETLRKPLSLIVASFILLFGAPYDFPLASALFLAVTLPLLGTRRIPVVAGVALILPLLIFFAFTSLGVPLTSFWLGS